MPGKRVNSQSQQMVLNVQEYFEQEKENRGPLLPVTAVQDRVVDAVKISKRTLYSINKRKEQNPVLRSPGKTRPRAKPKTQDLPDAIKMEVRNIIYNMYKDRKHVTLKSVNTELQTKEIVHMSTSSLATLLKNLGFKFKKDDNRRALIERVEIACMRSVFLRKYIENRNSLCPREVIFLDETWIYSKGGQKRSWQDNSVNSVRKPEGYDGKRFVIVHAGSEKGFIQGASLLFASRTLNMDYHGEMNGITFTNWLKNQLIPSLEEPSLIILDNAPYHSVQENKPPSTAATKAEIIQWLNKNNIKFTADMTKVELLYLVKINKKEKVYVVDNLLQEYGHEVLRLPPYHCDFNAIELIWARAKDYYNSNIGRDGYGDDKVLQMWNEALSVCDTNVWNNCVRHTNELIQKWYDREQYLANIDVNPIIIHPNEDSSSESLEESD